MSRHYLDHFGLAESPFSIAPSPRFLYMSQRHQEALAHLLYGLEGEGGFVLLTGDVGAGKTTIVRAVLERMAESGDVAYIFNPALTAAELLLATCVELGVALPPGVDGRGAMDALNAHLLELHARGRRAVLILDEAQNLAPETLEQMRLLTNLETSESKLLQIILVGQPELAEMLARPEARALAQRIVARYHLGPLDRTEVDAYVNHRLEVAGARRRLFPAALAGRLHRLSGGVPRLLNVLCDRALLGAYVLGRDRVDRGILERAAREVFGLPEARWRRPALVTGMALLMAGALAWVWAPLPAPPPPVVAAPKADARTALFHAWGLTYRGGDLCQEARAARLTCREARGDLEALRGIDRPALLRRKDGTEAALLGLAADHAVLVSARGRERITLAELTRGWSGEYRLFWRPPEIINTTLRPGDRGAAVDWLRGEMRRLEGDATPVTAGEPYDQALREQVRRFQRSAGLAADGNLGPLTLLPLMARLDRAAPSLHMGGG